MDILQHFPPEGIFLTGIESSDPFVDGVRRNQLQEAHDFYCNYRQRLKLIRDLGITWIRFGHPYSQTHLARDRFDFSFTDKVLQTCQELGITIIADLLHFGLPDWLHSHNKSHPFFQNTDFAFSFAEFTAAFADRYSHIKHYTTINEPFVTAYFSAKLGFWNEQLSSPWHDDRQFVRAAQNIAKAAILATEALLYKDNEIILVQNESFEKAIAEHPSRVQEAEQFNLRRLLPLDLIFGKNDPVMRAYFLAHGGRPEEFTWFLEHGHTRNTLLGIDHYPTCIHYLQKKRSRDADWNQPYQLHQMILEYFQRYKLPMLHTETNGWPHFAAQICQQTYDAIADLRTGGLPILGMGWYGDEYQMGWHHVLRGPRSFKEECPVGLHYKGKLQPVGILFSKLAQQGFPPINTSNT